MRGEVLRRVERRRRWSAAEKLAVVMASLEPDALVATVARRFDVTRQQVYDWRRAARRGELGVPGGVVGFVEVVAEPPLHVPAAEAESTPTVMAAMNADTVAPAAATTVEIVLVGGRMLRAQASLPTSELRRLISVVESA